MKSYFPEAIFFDLDGTLLDTAEDLLSALNQLRQTNGLDSLALAEVRALINTGSRAFLKMGFDLDETHPRFPILCEELFSIYEKQIAIKTAFFPDMQEILTHLEEKKISWGIITNKPTRLTRPLLHALKLSERPACVVCPDMVSKPKPSPESLFYACRLLNKKPENCMFVGDALSDIRAGKAAGMKTLLALYGYLHPEDKPYEWGADGYLQQPKDLYQFID